MDIKAIVGTNLQQIREARGFTQAFVAESCGFEPPSYSRWENGKSWPSPSTIEKLASFYGVPQSYFYRDEAARNVKPSLKEALAIIKEEMGIIMEVAPGFEIIKKN